MARFDVTDAEWALIEPHLPVAATGPLPRRIRDQFKGTLWRFRTVGIDALVNRAPKIVHLELNGNTWLHDISALSRLPDLEYLCLRGTAIHDLSPLAHLQRLARIDLVDCDAVRDLSALAGLPHLQTVWIRDERPDLDFGALGAAKRHRRPQEDADRRRLGRNMSVGEGPSAASILALKPI